MERIKRIARCFPSALPQGVQIQIETMLHQLFLEKGLAPPENELTLFVFGAISLHCERKKICQLEEVLANLPRTIPAAAFLEKLLCLAHQLGLKAQAIKAQRLAHFNMLFDKFIKVLARLKLSPELVLQETSFYPQLLGDCVWNFFAYLMGKEQVNLGSQIRLIALLTAKFVQCSAASPLDPEHRADPRKFILGEFRLDKDPSYQRCEKMIQENLDCSQLRARLGYKAIREFDQSFRQAFKRIPSPIINLTCFLRQSPADASPMKVFSYSSTAPLFTRQMSFDFDQADEDKDTLQCPEPTTPKFKELQVTYDVQPNPQLKSGPKPSLSQQVGKSPFSMHIAKEYQISRFCAKFNSKGFAQHYGEQGIDFNALVRSKVQKIQDHLGSSGHDSESYSKKAELAISLMQCLMDPKDHSNARRQDLIILLSLHIFKKSYAEPLFNISQTALEFGMGLEDLVKGLDLLLEVDKEYSIMRKEYKHLQRKLLLLEVMPSVKDGKVSDSLLKRVEQQLLLRAQQLMNDYRKVTNFDELLKRVEGLVVYLYRQEHPFIINNNADALLCCLVHSVLAETSVDEILDKVRKQTFNILEAGNNMRDEAMQQNTAVLFYKLKLKPWLDQVGVLPLLNVDLPLSVFEFALVSRRPGQGKDSKGRPLKKKRGFLSSLEELPLVGGDEQQQPNFRRDKTPHDSESSSQMIH